MTKKFEVGKKYFMRSPCDQNCIWEYKVFSRTDKSVKLQANDGAIKTCRVKVWSDAETCQPIGNYSMAPILSADKELAA